MARVEVIIGLLCAAFVVACSSGNDSDSGPDVSADAGGEMDGPADSATGADSAGDGDVPSPDGAGIDAGDDASVDSGDGDVGDADLGRDSGGECDLLSGSGCGAEEKCGLSSRDTISWVQGCIPLPSRMASSPGEACTLLLDPALGFFDNCPAGYVCLLRPGGTVRVCEKLCAADDANACSVAYPDGEGGRVDGICVYNIGRELSVPGLMACTPPGSCNPTCQDCLQPTTGESVGCYVATDGIHFGSICSFFDRSGEAGSGITGEPCGAVNSCAPGYYCHSTRRCRPYCDPGLSYPGDDDTCAFALCESRDEAGVGSCTVPEGAPEEMFSPSVGVALCLD